jgi:hypothetical protein
MTAILHQRCFVHSSREAVVRCPQCTRYYCRECVTEHEGRMMCATCVSALALPAAVRKSPGFGWAILGLGGVVIAWLIFYYLGALLARVPADFFDKPA